MYAFTKVNGSWFYLTTGVMKPISDEMMDCFVRQYERMNYTVTVIDNSIIITKNPAFTF